VGGPGREEPLAERCMREIRASRTAADRLELLSRAAVVVGIVVAIALAPLLATGSLELAAALDWLGAILFSVVLAGLGGYVSAWGLRLNASRLEMSVVEEAEATRERPPADREGAAAP
jgi:hypothetical protein